MAERQQTLSAELVERFAAIDIGTNSIRLVVAEPLRGGNYRILDEDRESTRLGRSLHTTGQLAPEAMEASLDALRRFRQIAQGYNVSRTRTIATCAVREASNGPEFCRRAKEESDVEVEVISSEKEARFAFHSVERSFDLTGKQVVMADIGGGSTEIVLASGNVIEAIYPTNLGAVRMSEIFGGGASMVGKDFDRLVAGIKKRLKKRVKKPMFLPHLLIGSGGTFTSLAEMMMARKNQQGLPVRGYQVSRAELRHLLDDLRKMPPKARRGVAGLNPDRADIIVAGLTIIDCLLARFKINSLQTHNRGVRDGLLLSMIEKRTGKQGIVPIDRDQAIERLAKACGVQWEHGRHTADLALQLHDQLAKLGYVESADRGLLEAAALLQDVGYLINYDQHHKHSYHLILNSRMKGFRPSELEIVANVARYHRGAQPKKRHANYQQLSTDDRLRVAQMAAILRLADGLDRSHHHQIQQAELVDGKSDFELIAISDEYPETDLWGARRRAGMFEKVFGFPLSVSWRKAGIRATTAPNSQG